MKIKEMALSSFYHRYLVIEADVLTEVCRKVIDINEQDCYALCSSYCDAKGKLLFNILAIGASIDNCHKGLEKQEILGILSMDEVKECEGSLVHPEEKANMKNKQFLDSLKEDEDLLKARMDWRLDDVRDLYYPDQIRVGIINSGSMSEYKAIVQGTYGPFLKCRLLENTAKGNLKQGDVLYAFPYMDEENDMCRLYAMFIGLHLNSEEEKAFHRIMNVSEKYGITFNGTQFKS